MEREGELSIDVDQISEKDYTKVKIGDCLVHNKRLYIITGVRYRIPEKSHQNSSYSYEDFCTKEKGCFTAITAQTSDNRVEVTEISSSEHILMNVDEDYRISILDDETNELKENIQINLEGEETKRLLNLAQSLLNESKEVKITFQTAAGVTIVSKVVGY